MQALSLPIVLNAPTSIVRWATVLSIVLTPYGEEFVALPLGLAFGLPLPGLLLLVPLGNFVPIVVIYEGWDRIQRIGRLRAWLEKHRNGRVWRFAQKYGLWPTALMGPLVSGVWTMTAALCLMGAERRRVYLATLVSLYVWAAIYLAAAYAGLEVLHWSP